MTYLIFREMKSDRRRRLYGRKDDSVSATARNIDEAADVAYHEMEKQEGFTKPIKVEGGPETKQAFQDSMLKIGQDPDKVARDWGLE